MIIFNRDFRVFAFFDCGVDIFFDIVFFTVYFLFTLAKNFLVREVFIHFLNESITKGMTNLFTCLVRPITRAHDDSNHTLITTFDGVNIVEGTFWARSCLQPINPINSVFGTWNRVVVSLEGFLVRCSFFNCDNRFASVFENVRVFLDEVIGHDSQITRSCLVGLVVIITLRTVVTFEGNSNGTRSVKPFGIGHP